MALHDEGTWSSVVAMLRCDRIAKALELPLAKLREPSGLPSDPLQDSLMFAA
jgi:hypothetical protein